jgi:acetylornithine/N-succinyldiaminopimelate aminotransferase
MTTQEIIAKSQAYELNVYARYPVAFVRGKGCRLWDADGKEYLDLFAGLAVTNLGHGHPAIVQAVQEQVATLMHASNLYYTEPAARLVEILCQHSFAERVFLSNSGAEANEAALKLARRYGSSRPGGRYEIIAAHGSFHGRTLATLTTTGQEKHRVGFDPLLPGIRLVPYDDVDALAQAVSDITVAVILEPIQGEGGVVTPGPDYLRQVRELCDRHGILLILDEVQVGIGRTGRLFAHEHAAITPDILTLAKALGGGLPIGATLTRDEIAASMGLGAHGSTFGGNPVACAAACRVIEVLLGDGVLEHCGQVAAYLADRLRGLADAYPMIRGMRGQGLILGLEIDRPARPIVEACLADGLVINATADRVLRFLPPLTIARDEIDQALSILERQLDRASGSPAPAS